MQPMRSRAPAVILISMLLVAGCAANGSPIDSTPTGTSPHQTDVAQPTSSPLATPCPNFVEHVETGPQPTDFSETGPVAVAQARLQHDIQAANDYGSAHPDEFGSIRLENAPRVRIVIAFTAHIAAHCAALRSLLDFPDEFEIVMQSLPQARLYELMQEIGDKAGSHLLGLGVMSDHLELALRPDGKATADALTATYGPDILHIVSIGFLGYPDINVVARPCLTMLASKIDISGLRAILTLDSPTVRSGQDFHGSVVIRNDGSQPAELNSGAPATAVVYRAGTNELVGGYAAGGGEVGFGGTIAPGASLTDEMVSGTASCVPALGYALPPGHYDVRAVVEQYHSLPAGGVVASDILSAPVPLEVVP